MIRFLRKLLRNNRPARGQSRRAGRRVEVEILEDRCHPSALALVAVSSEPVPPRPAFCTSFLPSDPCMPSLSLALLARVAVSSEPVPPRPAFCSSFLPSDPCLLSPSLPLP